MPSVNPTKRRYTGGATGFALSARLAAGVMSTLSARYA